MAAASPETNVTYEELADIEREFEDAETEIIRQQVQLTQSLYEKRHQTISRIPDFWPLVIEQAPPDIDEYIQPSDSHLLLKSLLSLSVSHFEIENGAGGDPRSISFRWEFSENEYFQDRILEKKFWYRRSKDGWCGLVSEPVDIKWKKGKDLTGGLLGLVRRVWEAEQLAESKKGTREKPVAEHEALRKKIESTGLGGLSFFAWFGYRGKRVSAEESRNANEKERERMRLRREGKEGPADTDDSEEGDDEDGDLEIFPEGGELAVCISEDLWPGAIKYFTQAQEQDAMSDDDFESDGDMEDQAGADPHPNKRQKT